MFRKKHKEKKELVVRSISLAVLEFLYIMAIIIVVSATAAVQIAPWQGMFLVSIALVVSAGVSAGLVLGYPLYLMLKKKEKEALLVLSTILMSLFCIFCLMLWIFSF